MNEQNHNCGDLIYIAKCSLIQSYIIQYNMGAALMAVWS